jgi:2-oxoglutarate ferredoxin oxidoreductase subunit gamma
MNRGAATMSDAKNISANASSQVRFGGVGGQGIVLAGRLLGKAAALFDGKEAVCTQSYGPEARGGASKTDVIISDEPVGYPFVLEADVLAVLFQEAYAKFRPSLKPGGTLIFDTGLVKATADDANAFGIPATKIAEDVGSRLAANVVILGFLVGKTGVVSRESVEKAIRATLKPKIVDLNIKALDAGISLAQGDAAA